VIALQIGLFVHIHSCWARANRLSLTGPMQATSSEL
jgi:hypothetical protein